MSAAAMSRSLGISIGSSATRTRMKPSESSRKNCCTAVTKKNVSRKNRRRKNAETVTDICAVLCERCELGVHEPTRLYSVTSVGAGDLAPQQEATHARARLQG